MEDYKAIVQEASGMLRKAESNMFSSKNQEAAELWKSAGALIEKAAQLNPDDFQVKSLRQKQDKLRKDLERKGIALTAEAAEKLPFEVEAQLGKIREAVKNRNLERAKSEIEEFNERFAGKYPNLPEFAELSKQADQLEQELSSEKAAIAAEAAAKAEAAQALEALNRKWEEEIKAIPYFEGSIRNVAGLLNEREYFRKAAEVMNRFKAETFPGEKSATLTSRAADLQHRLDNFEANYSATIAEIAGEVTRTVEECIDVLNRDTAWLQQSDLKPRFTGTGELESFEEKIRELKPLFSENDLPFAKLKESYSRLLSMNVERRNIRSKRITMRPAVMNGPDADLAVQTAETTALKYYPGAKVLKAAVIKEWVQKRTESWADNTRSQWVVRNFQETDVELAIRTADNNHSLLCMRIERDVNPDGSFGRISGHQMFEEMIAPENIM